VVLKCRDKLIFMSQFMNWIGYVKDVDWEDLMRNV